MPTREEKDTFSIMIEEHAQKLGVNHIDAITEYCSKSGMEIEVAASLLNSVVKSKIEMEFRNLRYLPKTAMLPV